MPETSWWATRTVSWWYPGRDAEELLEAARRNLAGEQEALVRMKKGTYTQQEHRDSFTSKFLDLGGEFI